MAAYSIFFAQSWVNKERALLNKDAEFALSFKAKLIESDGAPNAKSKEGLLDATTTYWQRRDKSMAGASQHFFEALRAMLLGIVALSVICMLGISVKLRVKEREGFFAHKRPEK